MSIIEYMDQLSCKYCCDLWSEDPPIRIEEVLCRKPDNVFEQNVHRTYDAYYAGYEKALEDLKDLYSRMFEEKQNDL